MRLRPPPPPTSALLESCWKSQFLHQITPMAEAARSPKCSHAAGRPRPQQQTNHNRMGPMGPDGAPGASSLRPRQRVLKIRGEKRSGFPREPALAPPGAGSSGGAHPSPHTPTCAGYAQPLSLGRGPEPLLSRIPLWDSGQGEKACCQRSGGRRDTEGTASQAGRGGCPWSRGAATEESRRATCPGPGCPASAPVLGDVSLLQQASVRAPQGPVAKTFGCPCRPWNAGKAPPPRSTCPGPSASQGWRNVTLE